MIQARRFLPSLTLTAWMLISTACGKADQPFYIPPPETTRTPESTATPVPVSFLPATSNTKPVSIVHENVQPEINPTVPAPETIQFEFTESNQNMESTWRPALYPVPLALTPFDHFYFSKPFTANENPWPVEDYRYGGYFFEEIVHTGMDIKIPVGTPVIAAGPGKIVWAGYGLFSGRHDPDDPYGNAVMIRHDFGYKGQRLYTVYAHLDRVVVEQDQYVESGDLLGLSGKTGEASGPHLHFEVRLDVNGFFGTRNPELWLVPPQGYGVLAGQVMNTGGRKVEGQLVIVRPVGSENFWRANSYHYGHIFPDDYYQENLVVSDLPAGRYEIQINYLSKIYRREIDIYPGLVTYFAFRGRSGFTSEAPPLPGSDFNPPQTP